MTKGRENMDWYLQEHTRIVESARESVVQEPRLKSLIIKPAVGSDDRAPWEDWIKDANRESFFILQQLRARANELWTSGSDDPDDRCNFTAAVETEYQLSIWAAKQYLKHVCFHGSSENTMEDEDYVRICRTCGRG